MGMSVGSASAVPVATVAMAMVMTFVSVVGFVAVIVFVHSKLALATTPQTLMYPPGEDTMH